MLYSLLYNMCEKVMSGKSQTLSRGAESYTHLARSTTQKGTQLSEKYGNTTIYSAIHRMWQTSTRYPISLPVQFHF